MTYEYDLTLYATQLAAATETATRLMRDHGKRLAPWMWLTIERTSETCRTTMEAMGKICAEVAK